MGDGRRGLQNINKDENNLRNVSCIFSTLSRNVFQTMLQTQEMYERAVEKNPYTLFNVPDDYWTQEMCERATERSLYALK